MGWNEGLQAECAGGGKAGESLGMHGLHQSMPSLQNLMGPMLSPFHPGICTAIQRLRPELSTERVQQLSPRTQGLDLNQEGGGAGDSRQMNMLQVMDFPSSTWAKILIVQVLTCPPAGPTGAC